MLQVSNADFLTTVSITTALDGAKLNLLFIFFNPLVAFGDL